MDDPYVERWSVGLRGRAFIDVGAHEGRYTIPLARRFQTGVAFEPFDGARVRLVAALAKWKLSNVTVRAEAVCERAGEARLFDFDGEGKSLFTPHPTGGDTIPERFWTVPTIRLDDLEYRTPVDFVKIDTEGSEIQVLDGAMKLLLAHKPTMQVEIHRATDISPVMDRLRPICRSLELIQPGPNKNIAWVLGYA